MPAKSGRIVGWGRRGSKAAQALLGHTSATLTADVYARTAHGGRL
jgi:integrase